MCFFVVFSQDKHIAFTTNCPSNMTSMSDCVCLQEEDRDGVFCGSVNVCSSIYLCFFSCTFAPRALFEAYVARPTQHNRTNNILIYTHTKTSGGHKPARAGKPKRTRKPTQSDCGLMLSRARTCERHGISSGTAGMRVLARRCGTV